MRRPELGGREAELAEPARTTHALGDGQGKVGRKAELPGPQVLWRVCHFEKHVDPLKIVVLAKDGGEVRAPVDKECAESKSSR